MTHQPSSPAHVFARWTGTRAALGVGAAWAVGVGVVTLSALALGRDARLCLFHNATGCPCATCGSTRAVLTLARGEPIHALLLNPLATLATIGVLAMLMTRRRRWTATTLLRQTAIWWTLLALLGLNWTYLLWRHWGV